MKAQPVVLQSRTRELLGRIGRAKTGQQRHVERAVMLLMAAEGASDAAIARELGVDVQRPRRWRKRWLQVAPHVDAALELASERDFLALVLRGLSDASRSGGPPIFGPEQVAKLIALACERPADCGLPFDHWTPAELAREAVKRGIVESISARHLDRILKRSRPAATQESLLDDLEGQAREP